MDNAMQNLAVMIPAYKPEEGLIHLCKDLKAQGFKEIIIVDDGSGKEFSKIFSEVKNIGCTLLVHEINKGKGSAIKTAFEYILKENADVKGVVTADADGQHLVRDIVRVGKKMLKSKNALVLGSRVLKGKVPLKSRFGNAITRVIFNLVSGQRIHDTQTGLRGIPISSLEKMVSLKGEHYEYEMDMLLEAKRFKLKIKEVEIETVYIDDNSGSHFSPLLDSWRIYRLIIWKTFKSIILFGGSSLFAFGIDYSMFALLTIIVPNISWLNVSSSSVIIIANIGARLVSATTNFLVNRNIVFGKKASGKLYKHISGYLLLVVLILGANTLIMLGWESIGLNAYIAKVITEALLFSVSFFVQRKIIFK